MANPTSQMPLHDPQFWVVTGAAVCAGAWILWRLVPKALLRRKRGKATRATLTVGGRPVDAKPAGAKPKCH